VVVDCLKITVDKSSNKESILQTQGWSKPLIQCQDARLKTRVTASLQGQDAGFKATSQQPDNAKMRGSKPASSGARCPRLAELDARVSIPRQCQTQGSRSASSRVRHPRFNTNTKTRSSRPASSITSIAKRRAKARISTASEPCVSVETTLVIGSIAAQVMRGVNPHYREFLRDNFTSRTPYS